MKTLVLMFALVAAPLSAQTIPQDFHAWFEQQVAGKAFGQQTLLDLAPRLPCVGSKITPPNSDNERTKIWDPTTEHWTRVGFGEGRWVWIAQGPAPAPTFTAADLDLCGAAPTPRSTEPEAATPSIDYARIKAIVHAEVDSVYQQSERTHGNVEKSGDMTQQLAAVRADMKAIDEKTNRFLGVASDVLTFTGKYIAPAVGAWIAAKKIGN